MFNRVKDVTDRDSYEQRQNLSADFALSGTKHGTFDVTDHLASVRLGRLLETCLQGPATDVIQHRFPN